MNTAFGNYLQLAAHKTTTKMPLKFKSKINGNHEITTKKWKRKFFLPHRDLNHGPLKPKDSLLLMSLANPI